MKKAVLVLLILSLCLSLCACGASAPEPVKSFSDNPDAISAASESVVMISVYNSNNDLIATGSGFPMFEEGIFVTNYHVIEGGTLFTANTESEMFFIFNSIVAADPNRDIAILQTNAKTGLGFLQTGDTSLLKKGEKVIAIGSPLGLINTVSDGMYSNIRSEEGNEYLQFTAPISHGSSGGALFNDKGEVIGITSASYIDGQNLNLAIPIEEVIDVWEHKDSYVFDKSAADAADREEETQIPIQPNVEETIDALPKIVGTSTVINGYISSFYSVSGGAKFAFLVETIDKVWGDKNGNSFYEELQRCKRGESALVVIRQQDAKPLKNGDLYSVFGTVDHVGAYNPQGFYFALRDSGLNHEAAVKASNEYNVIAVIDKG